MPIYGKNPLKFSSPEPAGRFPRNFKFDNFGFSMGKSENSDFSETIAACDMKVGRCRQLIEIMKVCEY